MENSKGMDFAKKQLMKYGWKEGKGLGQNENGIVSALKPKWKFDNAGLGYDQAAEFTNRWWEQAYNCAAENIKVKNGKLVRKKGRDFNIASYKSALSMGKNYIKNPTRKKEENLSVNGEGQHDAVNPCPLSDDELFKLCGGRTAHKGARHGLQLNGKLERIQQQESKFNLSLKQTLTSNDNYVTDTDSKNCARKKKRNRQCSQDSHLLGESYKNSE